ncbi:MAG TPA: bifunctional 4-hydroxy-2-oxoglutarate aldolase/2-dehydro-3-deoxy-phosphogluconate aldolase [Spirochaetia bacterium]|nr:bifunctional 4-hydroxy-2-oxoglutarate aldolase/2-dehydro-3-deoxy-phosphogluconate aldolase [Spirochaetia bacterium]
MNEILERIGEIGIVPVVTMQRAADAPIMGRALREGGVPLAEITFRTAAAEDSIAALAREPGDLLVGAGTVLTTDQVERAVGAGAKFIVTPGFNPRVVDFCVQKGIPITPGISSPSEIEMAIERGLEVVKVFPAGACGGVDFLKSVAGPFPNMRFIPTGGVDAGNLRDYLSLACVHAVGGTWITKGAAATDAGCAEISRLAREAVTISLGFELAHIGINEPGPERAAEDARAMCERFTWPIKDGASSVFAGAGIECMKSQYLGTHGHIAISTLSMKRALRSLEGRGFSVLRETAKEKDGRLIAVYLAGEIGGFAVHLLQK